MFGSIIVVGIGPGDAPHRTPAATASIESADVIVGYKTYLRLIDDLAPGIERIGTGMRQEVQRINNAIDLAADGKRVVIVSSGDAGVYGMAGLVYEVLDERHLDSIDVAVLPGVTALNAAASLLGAPLMTDFAAISLSDQLVPLEQLLIRVEMAVQADFVICLYNPRGRRRTEPFERACSILMKHCEPDRPVGIVRSAYRDGQEIEIVRLSELPCAKVDMVSLIIIGNRATRLINGKMVTLRGYASKYDLKG